MRTWLLWFLLAVAVSAASWREVTQRVRDQGKALASQLPQGSWGGEMSGQDLQLLLGVLDSLARWGEGEDQPLSRELVGDVRQSLQRYRQRLRLSAATLPNPAPTQEWLAQVEDVENHLLAVEKSFAGFHLPSQQQLALSPWDRQWRLPVYEGPEELIREARSIRIDAQTINGPLRGGGLGWGLNQAAGWSVTQDLQALIQAAWQFESVCNSRYEDVSQTYHAFQRLQHAYDRLWPGARSTNFSLRNIERALDRLDRFHRAARGPEPDIE